MADVMTVTGPVPADQLGFTLAHEHLLCDYTPKWNGPEYLLNDQELIYRELMRYKHAGGASIIDQTSGGMRCQTRDLGIPHPLALRELARRTGLNIILGTGWYQELFYDRRLYRTKTDQIAEELVRDVTEGIDGTDVKAGLLGEIGHDRNWISPAEERVLRAVARAHKKTGVTIATHAWLYPAGLDQLDLLEEEGVDPRRVIIGHCQTYPHHDYHAELARRGAYLSFDTLGNVDEHEHQRDLGLIKQAIDAGLVGHLLFSQDFWWKYDAVENGGKGFEFVAKGLRDELPQMGMTEEQFYQVTVENPRRALTGED
ncbi:MAG: phosphotriesterase-related protein [Chloroflexi bacterium]|nr:phosphotriesterase-related protein [Chloroflexota bacterium]